MPRSNSRKYKLDFSLGQLHYLRELVTDDLEMTDLDPDERQQAQAILRKVDAKVEDIAASTV